MHASNWIKIYLRSTQSRPHYERIKQHFYYAQFFDNFRIIVFLRAQRTSVRARLIARKFFLSLRQRKLAEIDSGTRVRRCNFRFMDEFLALRDSVRHTYSVLRENPH